MAEQRLTNIDRRAIWAAHGEKCFYCRKPLEWRALEIDHLVPEHLKSKPAERARILADYGLPADYNITAHPNLVPACGPCNGDKGGRLLEMGQMAILLTRSTAQTSTILKHREKYLKVNDESKSLVQIATALQNGTVKKDQLAEMLGGYSNGDPVLTLYQNLEFMDGAPVSEIRKDDIEAILDRPVDFQGSGQDYLRFCKGGKSIKIRTTRDYRQAIAEGFLPDCNYTAKASSVFDLVDGVLRAASTALPAEQSFIREPRVGVCDLQIVAADFLPFVPAEVSLVKAASIGDLLQAGFVKVTSVTSVSVMYECDGMSRFVVELMRADIDGDGIEDILVYIYDRALHGSMGGGFTKILTRRSADGLFEVLPEA